MVNVETSIITNRPIEEVFAFVTDIRNSSLWDSGLVDIQQTPQSPLGMGIRVTEALTFEPTAQGTKITWKMEMKPGGFFALAEPLVSRSLRRQLEAGLGGAKDLLESQVGVATS